MYYAQSAQSSLSENMSALRLLSVCSVGHMSPFVEVLSRARAIVSFLFDI